MGGEAKNTTLPWKYYRHDPAGNIFYNIIIPPGTDALGGAALAEPSENS